MRVLVAEDDGGLRETLSRGLRESGYTVDAVPDGQAAMEYLHTYDYEVVVLDCEVAHWGDPRFDVAFCLSHLLLKTLHSAERTKGSVPSIRLYG